MIDRRPLIRTGDYLYTDDVGRDACGIGGVASKRGEPSREVIEKTLRGLLALEHRGGICGLAGDGAGILCQIPQAFFREVARGHDLPGARRLRDHHRIAVGVLFLGPNSQTQADAVRAMVLEALAAAPVRVLGWRPVPVNPDALPADSRDVMPTIEHLLLVVEGDAELAEQFLLRARLTLRERFRQLGLDAYLPTLSTRLIGYKGLMTSPQFADFYADLHAAGFATGIALFHRRYSTNTYPDWTLAQPFRLLGHNGELNTIRTNRAAVHAYSRALTPPIPGLEILTAGQSDSGSLDEWVEHLVLGRGWSLLRALRLSIPPVWDSEADYWGQDAVDLFTLLRRSFGSLAAWDGPAGIVASDGRVLCGLVDRMGLRPVRWCSDDRGWLYIGSEGGVYGLDSNRIVASGQLQPGQMIALDTETGERLDSHQILSRIVAEVREELGPDLHGLNRSQIVVPESFDFAPALDDQVGRTLSERGWSLDDLLQAHGWDFDRAVFVKEMAKLRKEPLSSMGYDRVLTVFSAHHPTLFKYLQQTFAEVTNPPIDPYREGGAMSLATYLGRGARSGERGARVAGAAGASPDQTPLPAPRDPLPELPIRQLELSLPVLNDAVVEEMRKHDLLNPHTLAAVFPLAGGEAALREGLHRLRSEAERAVHAGYQVLCLSDKDSYRDGQVPIPSLLALAAVHGYLCSQGVRERCSLIVQAGDVQEGHDICCLIAFGADAVHPYLMMRLVRSGLQFRDPDTKLEQNLPPRECLENLLAALEDCIKKVISKMGITTIEGYRGAQLFEAVGFGPSVMEFAAGVPSRVGGIGLAEVVEDARWRLAQAEPAKGVLGRNRDYHAFNAKVRMALRKAATAGDSEDGAEAAYVQKLADNASAVENGATLSKEYSTFSGLVQDRTPTVLRDLFLLKYAATPANGVEPALDIIRARFRGAAMSHGALTAVSHMTIAAAFNELGSFSNSGEGGESRERNDSPEQPWGPAWAAILDRRRDDPTEWTLDGDLRKSRYKSRIRQVASGRFGVDAEYLVNADELQIKMAQGAKPGEGGQLMGKKVTTEIATIRHARPGTDLISPPPHHDIYSIEDLAQLIHDLKSIKPGIRVSVKLVAVENVGTIAVGVVKAGADIVEIDGIDGGTGAAMQSSKEHSGLPSEMGLAEAHQALALNGLRSTVRLRVGGGIKNGFDVVKYALLGADEFVFGQALMVSVGCIVCKSCHIPNCPTGITGSPEIYKGHPDHTKAYLLSLAEEVRGLLGRLGVSSLCEIVGRCDLLVRNPALGGRTKLIDVSRFLKPEFALSTLDATMPQIPMAARGACSGVPAERDLNARIMEAARDAIDFGQSIDLMYRARNADRSIGATLAGLIAQRHGREGLPNGRRIKVRLEGEAGQSFGAWCVQGLDLELHGWAQDGIAKGISGGTVVVTLDYSATDPHGEVQSVAGNNVAYGATGGTVYIGGRAGHRLGIRNSGATVVAEAAGKYACEYMTRGRVVILGEIENEIGSGMTGGELIVFDPTNAVPGKLHSRSVVAVDCHYVDYEWLHPVIIAYHARTGSRVAERILKNWGDVRRGRRLRKVLPLAVARKAEDYIAAGTNAG